MELLNLNALKTLLAFRFHFFHCLCYYQKRSFNHPLPSSPPIPRVSQDLSYGNVTFPLLQLVVTLYYPLCINITESLESLQNSGKSILYLFCGGGKKPDDKLYYHLVNIALNR